MGSPDATFETPAFLGPSVPEPSQHRRPRLLAPAAAAQVLPGPRVALQRASPSREASCRPEHFLFHGMGDEGQGRPLMALLGPRTRGLRGNCSRWKWSWGRRLGALEAGDPAVRTSFPRQPRAQPEVLRAYKRARWSSLPLLGRRWQVRSGVPWSPWTSVPRSLGNGGGRRVARGGSWRPQTQLHPTVVRG